MDFIRLSQKVLQTHIISHLINLTNWFRVYSDSKTQSFVHVIKQSNQSLYIFFKRTNSKSQCSLNDKLWQRWLWYGVGFRAIMLTAEGLAAQPKNAGMRKDRQFYSRTTPHLLCHRVLCLKANLPSHIASSGIIGSVCMSFCLHHTTGTWVLELASHFYHFIENIQHFLAHNRNSSNK